MKSLKSVIDIMNKAYDSLIPSEEEAKRLTMRYMEAYGIRPEDRRAF